MSDFAIEPLIHDAWYIGAWSHELDGGPIARRILGEDVVLFRSGDGTAAALEDRCCHRGVKLSLGAPVEQGLQCGYHGLVFDGGGACVVNPGEKPIPAFRVRAFPVVERQHFVWIWMGDPAQADPGLIVDFAWHDRTDEWNFHYARYDIAANYMFMIDNLMDLTHLGYVHTSTIGGNPGEHDDAELTTTRTERGARYVRWMMESTPPPSFVKVAGFEGKVDRWQDFEYVAPASVLQWGGGHDSGTGGRENREKPGGMAVRLFHHATPADAENFHYFFSTAVRGQALDSPANTASTPTFSKRFSRTRSSSRRSRKRSARTRRASSSCAATTRRWPTAAGRSGRCGKPNLPPQRNDRDCLGRVQRRLPGSGSRPGALRKRRVRRTGP